MYDKHSAWGNHRMAGLNEPKWLSGHERKSSMLPVGKITFNKGGNMENLPAEAKQHDIVNIEEMAMTPQKVMAQVQLIQQVMDQAMQGGEHYGVIPGTDKPTLLKAGAEKLCLTFRLNPEYDIIEKIRDKDFIAYTVKCCLYHIPTGQKIASGIGSCNSRETKYRWRHEVKPLEPRKAVPKNYWKDRNKEVLGGKEFRPWKDPESGQWFVATSLKIENDNPWDLDNTLIKMACKRALVAATLNATAASDIFTQDLEDMPNMSESASEKPKKKPTPKPKKAVAKKRVPDPEELNNGFNSEPDDDLPPGVDSEWCLMLNPTKRAKLFFVAGQAGVDENELEKICQAYTQGKPFDNEACQELIDNFTDALAAFKDGML